MVSEAKPTEDLEECSSDEDDFGTAGEYVTNFKRRKLDRMVPRFIAYAKENTHHLCPQLVYASLSQAFDLGVAAGHTSIVSAVHSAADDYETWKQFEKDAEEEVRSRPKILHLEYHERDEPTITCFLELSRDPTEPSTAFRKIIDDVCSTRTGQSNPELVFGDTLIKTIATRGPVGPDQQEVLKSIEVVFDEAGLVTDWGKFVANSCHTQPSWAEDKKLWKSVCVFV